MSRLVFPLLAALVLAAPALAQEAVLGGWTLPAGTVVTSESSTVTSLEMRAGSATVPIESEAAERLRTTIERATSAGVDRAVQRLLTDVSKTEMMGDRVRDDPDPLLGRDVLVERTADGWARSALGWTPDAAALDALAGRGSLDDAEYPARPIAVGETVDVPERAVRAVYETATDGPQSLTVTLDSLGTVGGAPVAYLTQACDVTVDVGDGGTMHMAMTARIVRRLDWMLDVETVWEGPVALAFPGMEMTGTMRMALTQTAAVPDGVALLGDA